MVIKRKPRPSKKSPREPWTLKRGLSYSALSTFNRNREEFRLSYVEGWYNPGLITAMEWGSLFHYLLEHDGSVNAVIRKYKAKNWTPERRRQLTAEDVESLDLICQETAMMLPYYKKFWANEDKSCKWVDRERWFNLDFDVDGVPVTIRGIIDGVFRKNKKLWVFETKTKGRIQEENLSMELTSDFQIMLYCLACSSKKLYGEEPVGVRYNVIKRPGLYRRKGEKLKDFVHRSETDVIADPTKYFKRWKIDIEPRDLEEWRQQQFLPMLRNFLTWYNGFSSPEELLNDPFRNPLHYKGTADSLYIKAAKSSFHKALTVGDFSDLKQKGV